MATWRRFGIGLFFTLGLMVGGLIYNRVWADLLFPMIDTSSRWATAAVWADRLVPLILVMLLLATWAWVLGAGVQEERGVDRRRRVR